jgi:hypothetical protein
LTILLPRTQSYSYHFNIGIEFPTVFVLFTDNKFDFYNITEIADKKYKILDKELEHIIVKKIFTIRQLASFLKPTFHPNFIKS